MARLGRQTEEVRDDFGSSPKIVEKCKDAFKFKRLVARTLVARLSGQLVRETLNPFLVDDKDNPVGCQVFQ